MANGQTPETQKLCKEAIYSNEYVEMLIEDQNSIELISQYLEIGCIQYVNYVQAILHVKPVGETLDFIGELTYRMVPNCYGLMDTSNIENIGVLQLRRRPYIDLYGNNVLFAIIDTGIDYLHPIFRNADNTSRILGIWDQSIETGPPPEGLLYGSYYDNEDINRAIASETPYDIVPSRDDESGHGTFLAGIAAGNIDEENDFTGIAPQAGIIVVKLKQAKQNLRDFYGIREGAICFQESDVLMALKFVSYESRKHSSPIVCCFGFGSNQGDHNGSSMLGNNLSAIGTVSGIGNVISAGNETNNRHHYFGTISAGVEYQDVEIEVGENERGFIVELWAKIPLVYSVGVISPEGEFSNRIPASLGRRERIQFLFERTEIYVKYELIEIGSGDELIFLSFLNPTSGLWRIRVYNDNLTNGEFHMWLPIEDFLSSDTFFVNANPFTTICEPGNANRTFTVAAYDHVSGSIYGNSSRGYTRNNEVKPILTAPGVNIYGPVPGGGFSVRSGTSIAAAHGAGVCVLLMEWGLVERHVDRMSTNDLERFLIRGAKRDMRVYPNREWGYGVLDIIGTFESFRTTI